MGLSSDLVSQFAKITKIKKAKNETTCYGTIVEENDKYYVKLDGSDRLTPAITTVAMLPGERVTVMIKNHSAVITGNISSPSARFKSIEELENTTYQALLYMSEDLDDNYYTKTEVDTKFEEIPDATSASTTTPKMNGVATPGTETNFARGDHVHPSDTSKADKTDLENYYSKTEIDAKFDEMPEPSEVNLDNYYTKTEVDTKFDEIPDNPTKLSELENDTNFQVQPITKTITLAVDAWDSDAKTQSISDSDITASSIIYVAPAPSSHIDYANALVRCTEQYDGRIIFLCETIPTTELSVNIMIW